MKHLLLTSAAALLLAAPAFTVVPASAQTAAPAPLQDTAPAVPQTQIGVEERRQLMVNEDDFDAPQGLMIDGRGMYFADCSDPNITCENFDNLSTGSVGGTAPATGVGVGTTTEGQIGLEDERQLRVNPDDQGGGGVPAPQ